MINTKFLDEALGGLNIRDSNSTDQSRIVGNKYNPAITNGPNILSDIPQRPAIDSNIYKPTEDQKRVQGEAFRAILAHKNILINFSPSGGKTKPILDAYKQLLMDSKDITIKIPKMLFVAATKQLALQTYESFRSLIINMLCERTPTTGNPDIDIYDENKVKRNPGGTLSQQIHRGIHGQISVPIDVLFPTMRLLDRDIYDRLSRGYDTLNSDQLSRLNRLLLELIYVRAGGSSDTIYGNTKITEKTLIFISTYSVGVDLLNKFKDQFRVVVIDEMQEYLNKPSPVQGKGDEKEDEEKIQSFIKICIDTPKSSSLVLMTGSTNKNTTDGFIDIMKELCGKDIEPIDGIQRNRSNIKIVPYNLSTMGDTIELGKKIILNNDKNSLIISFSVGTDPGDSEYFNIGTKLRGSKIMEISRLLLTSTPKYSPEDIVGKNKPSSFRSLESNNSVNTVDFIKQRRRGMNVQGYTDIKTGTKSTITDLDELNDMLQGYSIDSRGNKIKRDKFLGECILHKFGYIAGGYVRRQSGDESHSRDINLVQKLFVEGKISLLFSTDAVGVGANLMVRKLYIISIKKPKNDGGYGKMNKSSLIQLVHRIGRSPFESGVVYCDIDDFNDVKDAIESSNPNDVPSVSLPLKEIKKEMRKKFISNSLSYLFNKLRNHI